MTEQGTVNAYFKALKGYPKRPLDATVYILAKEGLKDLKEALFFYRLNPHQGISTLQIPLEKEVFILVNRFFPLGVEKLLEEEIKNATWCYGGNLFHIDDAYLGFLQGVIIGDVYKLQIPKGDEEIQEILNTYNYFKK